MLKLFRSYLPQGTPGRLYLDGEMLCWTLEPPWKDNQRRESCIPPGTYFMEKRESPVVRRINGVDEGWEITDVPDRDFIMVHSGNWVSNSSGCVLCGRDLIIHDNQLFITRSQDTFKSLMEVLDQRNEWEIEVATWVIQK